MHRETQTKKAPFDNAVYEAMSNKCWFNIQCGGVIARFRLHMDADVCWNLFKAMDYPELCPHKDSSFTFRWGASKQTNSQLLPTRLIDVPECERNSEFGTDVVPERFEWLEECLAANAEPIVPHTGKFCHYYGVRFFRADEVQ